MQRRFKVWYFVQGIPFYANKANFSSYIVSSIFYVQLLALQEALKMFRKYRLY